MLPAALAADARPRRARPADRQRRRCRDQLLCARSRTWTGSAGAGILMLLDRLADVFMAQIARCDGWLIKPVDAVRLRRAPPPCWPATPTGRACSSPRPEARAAVHRWGATVVPRFNGWWRSLAARCVRDAEAGSSNLPHPTTVCAGQTAVYRCPQATTTTRRPRGRPHLPAGRAGGQWHGAALGSTCRRLSSDSSAARRTVADSGLITVPLDSPPARTPPAAVSDLADVEASFVDPCDHEAQESCSPGVRCTPGDMGCPDVIVEVAEVNPQMFTTGASVSGTLAS